MKRLEGATPEAEEQRGTRWIPTPGRRRPIALVYVQNAAAALGHPGSCQFAAIYNGPTRPPTPAQLQEVDGWIQSQIDTIPGGIIARLVTDHEALATIANNTAWRRWGP
jgi:hypothetical protein